MTGRTSPQEAAPDAVERLDLSAHASSATLARRFIRQFAARHSLRGELVDQLVLVGCELVTNAVLHARTELGLALELYPDRVRVSVRDQASTPAALRHYRPEALTGRGLAMVDAVSRSWGVDPAGTGKRIWAEIGPTPNQGPSRGPGARRSQAAPAQHRRASAGAGTRTVRFVGVPVKAYLELQQYNDALFREIELIGIALDTPGARGEDEPDRLVSLVEQLRPMFRASSDRHRESVAAAAARGQATVDIELLAAPSIVPAARTYVDLLEEAENLSRSGRLLTPPPPAYVSSLRRWFVDQLAAQLLEGASPLPPGDECLVSSRTRQIG
jgi:anti-sigma regulatory factor (Ser/Thr protein kinase)